MSQPEEMKKFVGVLTKNGDTLIIKSCDKKERQPNYPLNPLNSNGAKEGDVVLAERPATGSAPQARVTQILGQKDSPKILSIISFYEQGLSDIFSQAALKQARSFTVPGLEDREDIRNKPLVTVDPKPPEPEEPNDTDGDAEKHKKKHGDYDDAIYAEDTADGGSYLIVAIADVSWYVRPGDAIDQEAYARGNSTYLPDYVVPMLPRELSNGLCSLIPYEDRASFDYHLWIDKDGELTNYEIKRGLMRSAARLTYEQLQAAKDGNPDSMTAPLMDTVVKPLYAAYEKLKAAADRRGMLSLEASKNNAEDTATSHDVIAQFMILANVAGDMALIEANAASIHRFHSEPPEYKIEALREYLSTVGLALPTGKITSLMFKNIMEEAKKMPDGGRAVIRAIAMAQSKAVYDSQKNGHYGLALPNGYGHHTSPIRRGSDLDNQRSLVDALSMGAGGLSSEQKAHIQERAEHYTHTENLSKKAERAAKDRFAADYLSTHIGEDFKGRITGVIGGGVFVRLNSTGSEGLLPIRSLPNDYYNFDDKAKTLTGKRNGLVFKPGDEMVVRVKEAEGLTGKITFEPANDNKAPPVRPKQDFNEQNTKRPQQRKRNRNRHHRPG